MIVIVDYGLGNLRSVQKAFERIGVHAQISGDVSVIQKSERLVLPGVGHFAKGMENLKRSGLIEVLNKSVLQDKTPILGICLGMQLMTSHSEEGDCEGLNWIDAQTIKFEKDPTKKFKVPHIGWNSIELKNQSNIIRGLESDAQFYFVHSYYVICNDESDVLSRTEYGRNFHSGFQKDNIIGVQFHPEKSYTNGLQMLKNFSVL